MKKRIPRSFYIVKARGPKDNGVHWDIDECRNMACNAAELYCAEGYREVEVIHVREVLPKRRVK